MEYLWDRKWEAQQVFAGKEVKDTWGFFGGKKWRTQRLSVGQEVKGTHNVVQDEGTHSSWRAHNSNDAIWPEPRSKKSLVFVNTWCCSSPFEVSHMHGIVLVLLGLLDGGVPKSRSSQKSSQVLAKASRVRFFTSQHHHKNSLLFGEDNLILQDSILPSVKEVNEANG